MHSRRLVVTTLLPLVVALAPPQRSQADEPPVEERLKAQWGRQREVQSARIEYLWCMTNVAVRPLTLETARTLFAGVEFGRDPAAFNTLVPVLFERQYDKEAVWLSEKVLLIDGEKFRDQSSGTTIVGDGENEVVLRPQNQQFTIFARGQSRRFHIGLDELRWFPDSSSLESAIVLKDGDTSRLSWSDRSGSVTATVDRKTGMPLEYLVATRDGVPIRCLIQKDPIDCDGLVIPRVSIDLEFSEGKLELLQVAVVKDARFNLPIDARSFEVSARKGDVVIDNRPNAAWKLAWRLDRDVTSVVAAERKR